MPRKIPSKEELAEFRKTMNDMAIARLEMFGANVTKYAEVLGKFRVALEKSGFSEEESMQIVLKVIEQRRSVFLRRPMFAGGHGGHWHK